MVLCDDAVKHGLCITPDSPQCSPALCEYCYEVHDPEDPEMHCECFCTRDFHPDY